MLHPTPAEISVNFTPCWMAALVPSLGLTRRVLTRSDLAPTRMHLLPARCSLEDRSERQARLFSEQESTEFKMQTRWPFCSDNLSSDCREIR